MKLTAEVIGVGQKINFENGGVTHTMDLEIYGTRLTVDIDEKQAETLVGLFAQASREDEPTNEISPAPLRLETVLESANGDQVMIFGSKPEPAPQPRRSLSVSMDEMGNPIVRGAPPPPPEDPDEDGVPAA